MAAIFHITRALIFLILTSFASTALSITVNSESGGASIDGTWAFPGCNLDAGEFDDMDYMEYLVFQGNTVESRIDQYESSDVSCSGVGTTVESEIFNFTDEGDVDSAGWEEPPGQPTRQDGNGLLDEFPIVTEIAILIPGEDSEAMLLYIDDTALIWYLYRDAGGDDDPPSLFLSGEEPLIKTDLGIGVIPIPAGIWLFGTALIGFVGMSRRRKVS
jgi:hypothetical protein